MRAKAIRQTALALALSTSFISGIAAAQNQYSGIVIFGDSLSDPGNIPKFFGIDYPPAPYFENQFSNGPIYAKSLDALFGISTPLQDFAIGGAGTGTNNIGGLNNFPNQVGLPNAGMDGEISLYLKSNPAPDPRSLFIVWGGANDYFDLLNNFKGGGPTGSALRAFALSANGPVTVTVGGLVTDITRLAQVGVKNFVVPNLPNLGATPSYLGNAKTAGQAMQVTNLHNQELAAAMGALQQKLHVNITIVDISSVFKGVIEHPAQFGLDPSHITQECIQSPACVSQHQAYLFWDDVHPTGQVQAELAYVFMASLDGPTTVGPEIDLDKLVQQDLFDHISARTAALRLGAAGLSFSNIGGASGSIGDGDHPLAAFITDSYGWGSRDARDNVVSFDYDHNMISGGLDYRLNDWSAVGGLIGYSSTHDTLGNSLGSQSFDSYQAAIYGTAFLGGWYGSLAATYAYEEWGKIDRNVFIGNQVAHATTNGHVFGGKIEGGYVMQMGQWSFGPAAEIRMADYHIGSYTERGTFGLNQQVDSQNVGSVVGQFGVQAALSTMLGDYAVTPQIRLNYDHEFHGTTRAITTRIASQAATFVTTDLAPEGDDYARIGVGVDVKLNSSFSALVDFDSTVGREGGEDYSMLARLKGSF